MKSLKIILPFLIFLLVGCAHEIESVVLKEAPKPDNEVLIAATNAINEYYNLLQWKDQCTVKVHKDTGIIETNWHPVHKGEMKRKIQIYVWGKMYRVDVWHKGTFSLSEGQKDYMARLVELNLQSSIENKL